MIKEIKKIKDTVELILRRDPRTRDCDQLLALLVWHHQNSNIANISFMDFSKDFKSGKYANYISITRSRALLQSEFEELRGENYNKRHQLAEETRKEIVNL
jgi:hypothetical protein